MSVDPEFIAPPEQLTAPSFVIDEDAPPALAQQLRLDQLWLLKHPLLREAAIQKVGEATDLRQDSIWKRLTDIDTVRYFEFDKETEKAIKEDGAILSIASKESTKNSIEMAENLAFQRRKRRLEIFIQRAKLARGLGCTALGVKPEE